jgi:hypothetical protein
MKKILTLLLPAALLLTACATTKRPKPYTPEYFYMVLYGGTFRGYPWGNSGAKEKEIETSEIVGGLCLTPDDWEKRTNYILDLEAYAEGK